MDEQSQKPPVTEQLKQELNKIPPTNDRNLMAALSYLWILSIVMLIVKKDDAFVKFHAKQGLILLIASCFTFIPVFGWILGFVALIGVIMGFINAWQGREYQLPFVYMLSQKLNF